MHLNSIVFTLSLFSLFSINIFGQIAGCTDPLATNYNSSATVNDGSCLYPPTSVAYSSNVFLSDTVSETSGLVKVNQKIFTINDSGGQPALYAINKSTGNIVQKITISNAQNVDWEALCCNTTHIFIGDFGNNAGTRTDLTIYKVAKDSLLQSGNYSITADIITFAYTDQTDFSGSNSNHNFDCEACIAMRDSIFLFSKNRGNLGTKLYGLPNDSGQYTAILLDSFFVDGFITGAESINEQTILLTGYKPPLYNSFLWMLWEFGTQHFFAGNKRKFDAGSPADVSQMEAVVFTDSCQALLSGEAISQFNIPPRLRAFSVCQYLHPNTASTLKFESVKLHATITENALKIKLQNTCCIEELMLYGTSGRRVVGKRYNANSKFKEIKINGYFPSSVYILRIKANNTVWIGKVGATKY